MTDAGPWRLPPPMDACRAFEGETGLAREPSKMWDRAERARCRSSGAVERVRVPAGHARMSVSSIRARCSKARAKLDNRDRSCQPVCGRAYAQFGQILEPRQRRLAHQIGAALPARVRQRSQGRIKAQRIDVITVLVAGAIMSMRAIAISA